MNAIATHIATSLTREELEILDAAERIISTKLSQCGQQKLTSFSEVTNFLLKTAVSRLEQEVFGALFFSDDLRLLNPDKYIFFVGGLNTAEVDIRLLCKHAVSFCATKVILFHNHVHQNAEPSDGDIETTIDIRNAFDLLGISLLDHIIVSGSTVCRVPIPND